MDEHYQTLYDKCRRALSKLEERKTEVQKLNLVLDFNFLDKY